jgi:hypothetical protein
MQQQPSFNFNFAYGNDGTAGTATTDLPARIYSALCGDDMTGDLAGVNVRLGRFIDEVRDRIRASLHSLYATALVSRDMFMACRGGREFCIFSSRPTVDLFEHLSRSALHF